MYFEGKWLQNLLRADTNVEVSALSPGRLLNHICIFSLFPSFPSFQSSYKCQCGGFLSSYAGRISDCSRFDEMPQGLFVMCPPHWYIETKIAKSSVLLYQIVDFSLVRFIICPNGSLYSKQVNKYARIHSAVSFICLVFAVSDFYRAFFCSKNLTGPLCPRQTLLGSPVHSLLPPLSLFSGHFHHVLAENPENPSSDLPAARINHFRLEASF